MKASTLKRIMADVPDDYDVMFVDSNNDEIQISADNWQTTPETKGFLLFEDEQ